MSRTWVEEVMHGLNNEAQATARLLLLTALAPYQIDEQVVQVFRRYQPGDEKLVKALAWTSFTAARRVGTWLSTPLVITRNVES